MRNTNIFPVPKPRDSTNRTYEHSTPRGLPCYPQGVYQRGHPLYRLALALMREIPEDTGGTADLGISSSDAGG